MIMSLREIVGPQGEIDSLFIEELNALLWIKEWKFWIIMTDFNSLPASNVLCTNVIYGHVVVQGLWDLWFPYKYDTLLHHNNESCTYNYEASAKIIFCCVRQINVLSSYLR